MEIIMPKRKHRIWNTTDAKSFSSCRLVCLPLSIACCSLLFNTVYRAPTHSHFGCHLSKRNKNAGSEWERCIWMISPCSTFLRFKHHHETPSSYKVSNKKCTLSMHTHSAPSAHTETCECDKTLRLASRFAPRECKWGCWKAEHPKENGARLAIKRLSEMVAWHCLLFCTFLVFFEKFLAKMVIIIRWCCQSIHFSAFNELFRSFILFLLLLLFFWAI